MNKKTRIAGLLIGLSLIVSQAGFADDRIGLPESIPFAEEADIREAVRNECKLEEKTATYLRKYLKKSGFVSDSPNTGKYLDMKITHVRATGGGMYSGPKWMEVIGTLNEEGKPGPSFRAKRFTTGGFRACSAAARCAKAIAKDISKWARSPVDGAELGDAK